MIEPPTDPKTNLSSQMLVTTMKVSLGPLLDREV